MITTLQNTTNKFLVDNFKQYTKKENLIFFKKKLTTFFFFEQNVNVFGLKFFKWNIFTFEIFEELIFDFKIIKFNFFTEFFKPYTIANQMLNNCKQLSVKKIFINNFEINFIQFLSSKNFFLSSNQNVDAYFYNDLVLKYTYKKDKTEKKLINDYNLPKDFFSKQTILEKKLYNDLWEKIPYKNDWIYDVDDLYIADPLIPFDKNQHLVDIINSATYDYDLVDWYLGWEIKSYYYDEPFFFLRDIKEQPVFDYRTLLFLWYRTNFFEDLIFWDPYWNGHHDEKHIYPPYSIWTSGREMQYSFEWYECFLMYIVNSTRLDHFLFQLDGLDLLWTFFDKNFLYLWHYFWGGFLEMDFVYQYGMITWLQKIQTELYNPLVNWPSQYTILKAPYFSSFERSFYMSIFPDTAIPKGRLHFLLDYWTADFNRFFHAGFTFMDGLSLLEIYRYHASAVVWGGFDSFTEDFMFFQAVYYLEQMNAIWLGLIILLLKDTSPIWWYDAVIWNYNTIFNFSQFPAIWKNLKAETLAKLNWKQKFQMFYDIATPDMWIHQTEWLVGMLFGYNVSLLVNNHPMWYTIMRSSNEIYQMFGIDPTHDETREEFNDWILESYSSLYFSNIDIFFKGSTFIPQPELFKYFSSNNIYMKYINEKFYDDMGYFFTSLMWGENPISWKPLLNFNNLLIKYSDKFPYLNDVWLQLYSLYKSLDLHIFFRYIGLKLPFYVWPEITKKEIKQWFFETFEISWKETLVWEAFLWRRTIINYAANCPWYMTLHFSIWLDKLFGLFFDLKPILNSNFFFFIHFFIYSQWSTFEIISKENFINFFFFFKKLISTNFFYIKINNEPLQSYFDLIYEIYKLNFFQYLLDFIFNKFLVAEWVLVGVNKLSFNNYSFSGAAVNFVHVGPRNFPLEFYVPFLIWPTSDFILIENHKTHFPFNIKLYEYFKKNELEYEEYLEKLILLMMINEAIKDNIRFETVTLHTTLTLLNDLEIVEPRFIGFGRYLNYVLKRELYYNTEYGVNLDSNYHSTELSNLNKTVNVEFELKKKLLLKSNIENIYGYDEEFFNMCTDDLKEVLNFWAWKLQHKA